MVEMNHFYTMKQSKLEWAGHTSRKQDSMVQRILLENQVTKDQGAKKDHDGRMESKMPKLPE